MTATVAIVGALCALIIVVLLPKLQLRLANITYCLTPEEKLKRVDLENELRKTSLQIVGGVFLVAGAFFSWNQFVQTKERDLSNQINEIVTLIGNDKEYVQIGAIYSLKLVTDNHKSSSALVMDILSSFLRDHAAMKDTDLPYRGSELTRASLQIISDAISKSDFHGVDLSDTDFRSLQLRSLNLNSVVAINTRFDSSDLEGTIFKEAELTSSNFDGSNLVGASFVGANLSYTSFKDANIRGSDFSGANLSGLEGLTEEEIKSLAITDKNTQFP